MSSAGSQGSDSKIAHAYDQALAQAQTDAEEIERAHEQHNGEGLPEPPMAATGGAVNGELSGSMPDEEEGLRGHDFPIPPDPQPSASRRLVVNQNTLPQDESRNGNQTGQRDGDIQSASAVPSVLDQDAVAPDLASEQR